MIVLVALILRLIGLTRESLWSDELFTAYSSLLKGPLDVIDFLAKDVHPPGHNLGVWGWVQIFGDSEFSLRLSSALGGVLLVPVAFRLGRQLFDVQTGLVAAFVSAILIQGVYFSQELRANIWMAFLSALAVSLAIDYVRSRGVGSLVLLTLVSIANFYSHYFGSMFSILLWAGVVWRVRQKGDSVWPAVGAGAISFLAFAPWVSIALNSVKGPHWLQRPGPKELAEIVNVFYGPGYVLDLLAVLVLAAGFFFARPKQATTERSKEWWVALWLLVPFAAAVGFSYAIRPVYWPRSMLLGYGSAAIILARALIYLAKSPSRVWPVAIAFTAVHYGLHFATGKGYFVTPTKQQVRETAQFIADHNMEGLPIFAAGWDRLNFTYYFRRTKNEALLQSVSKDELKERGLANVLRAPRFWVASAGVNIDELEDVSQNFEIEQRGEYLQARAYLLRRKQ